MTIFDLGKNVNVFMPYYNNIHSQHNSHNCYHCNSMFLFENVKLVKHIYPRSLDLLEIDCYILIFIFWSIRSISFSSIFISSISYIQCRFETQIMISLWWGKYKISRANFAIISMINIIFQFATWWRKYFKKDLRMTTKLYYFKWNKYSYFKKNWNRIAENYTYW